MRGEYVLVNKAFPDKEIIIPNNIVAEGAESFLKMAVQASVADVSSGGNFYLGLCGNVFATTLTLSTLTGEPTATNGYSRQAIARNGTGWPTITAINGVYYAETAQADFTASGGDFSAAISRFFLCNASSGASGILYSLSGPLGTAITITDGQTYSIKFRLFMFS